MEIRPPSDPLTIPEQAALIETLGDVALQHVLTDTVTARLHGDRHVLLEWDGVAIIPLIQFDSVLLEVAAEQAAREAGDA